MATWTSSWTNLNQINGGNQLTNNDVPTADIFNKTINNVGAVKDALDDFKGKLVTSWSSTPVNTNFPSEKLVKDNLDYLEDNLDNLTTTVNSINNSYVKKVVGDTSIDIDGGNIKLKYKYSTQAERYINVADDGIWIYDKDYASVLGDVNLCQKLVGYDDDIYDLQSTVQLIQNKFNGNNIAESSANADSITSTGLYAINFYLSNLTTVTHTAMLNITNLNTNHSVILNCGTTSSNYITEVFYSGTSHRITISVRSTATITATITSCNKIAKIE